MSYWAPFALTGVTATLLLLPVTPALYELRKRRDAAPLPTSRHDGRIANFADAFQSRLEPLLPQLKKCRDERELLRTHIDGMEVLLVGSDDFNFDPDAMKGVNAVICGEAATVPSGRLVEADVYADSSLELGEGAVLRAALGARDIVLGEKSAVMRWLHARGNIYLRQGSAAYGRLSAGQSICLEKGSGFQRMHAPKIVTVGLNGDGSELIASKAHVCQSETGNRKERDDLFASRERIRVLGNFVLPTRASLNANVIATGEMRIGSGARFFGNAKSYKDTVVEADACVHGSVVCGGTLRLGPRSYVAGPVMAEGDVLMDGGSCVGGPDALTTMSSSGAKIAAGCRLHGTVWARVQGNVEN